MNGKKITVRPRENTSPLLSKGKQQASAGKKAKTAREKEMDNVPGRTPGSRRREYQDDHINSIQINFVFTGKIARHKSSKLEDQCCHILQ